MNGMEKRPRPRSKRKIRRLAKLNRRIVRLSSELETLHYMQDRLEREIERDAV